MRHPSAAPRRSVRRHRRLLSGSATALGVLALGLACEPGIPSAPQSASSVRLSPRGQTFEVGDSLRITAAALDASGTTLIAGRPVRWTSSAPGIARVDSLGWVAGRAPGSSIITAEVDGHTDTATVHILAPSVQAVELSTDTATIIIGQSRQLVATVLGRRDTVLTDRTIEWTTSAPAVATVSMTGVVTATGFGTATITAASEGRQDTAQVTVVPVPVKQVVVTPTPALVQLGATLQMTADPQDSTGASLAGRTVTWGLTNGAIATVSTSGLVTGTATGTGSVTATSEGVTTTVPLTVAVPVIAASRLAVSMTDRATGPNPAPELVSITNGGPFTLSGLGRTITYAPGQPTGWLAATFNQATAPATLTLQATTGSLAPGTYGALVAVTSSQQGVAPVEIAVTFTVVPQPQIALSATAPSFGAQAGGGNPDAQVVSVTNGGTGTLSNLSIATSYQGGQPTGWLGATLGGTTAPTTVTLQPVTGSLPVGTYNATVTVSSTLANVAPRTIAVSFTVSAGPAIGVSSTSVPLAAIAFSPTPAGATVNITNTGGGGTGAVTGLARSITYGSGSGWLTATLGGTADPTTLSLSASAASLAAGTYTATVTLTSTAPGVAPRDVGVTFTVGSQPVIARSPSSASFDVTRGAALPSPTLVSITNAGGGTLSGLSQSVAYGSGSGWLTATLSGTTAPATLTLQPNTTSLAAGTYTATVTLSSTVPGVADATVPVTLVVRQPQVAVSTNAIALGSRTRGDAIASSTVSVTNAGQGTLSGLSVSDDASWITPSLNTTTAPATLTLAYNTSALAAGTYNGTVTVSSSVPGTTPQAIGVSVTVLQPQIGLSATSVARTVTVGTNATGASISVTNSGSGTLDGLARGTITYSAGASGWVTATLNSGTAPATLTITINSSSIATAGTFTATIPVTSTVPGVVTQNVTVTVTTRWSFATHIRPLLTSCDGCHSQTFTYANLVNALATTTGACGGASTTWRRIVPNNTTSSLLYRKLLSTVPCGVRMPQGGPYWSQADIDRVAAWINDGAPNN